MENKESPELLEDWSYVRNKNESGNSRTDEKSNEWTEPPSDGIPARVTGTPETSDEAKSRHGFYIFDIKSSSGALTDKLVMGHWAKGHPTIMLTVKNPSQSCEKLGQNGKLDLTLELNHMCQIRPMLIMQYQNDTKDLHIQPEESTADPSGIDNAKGKVFVLVPRAGEEIDVEKEGKAATEYLKGGDPDIVQVPGLLTTEIGDAVHVSLGRTDDMDPKFTQVTQWTKTFDYSWGKQSLDDCFIWNYLDNKKPPGVEEGNDVERAVDNAIHVNRERMASEAEVKFAKGIKKNKTPKSDTPLKAEVRNASLRTLVVNVRNDRTTDGKAKLILNACDAEKPHPFYMLVSIPFPDGECKLSGQCVWDSAEAQGTYTSPRTTKTNKTYNF
jgi:hypothetical protein